MNLYKPQHIVNGNTVFEDLVECPYRNVITKLFTEKGKLEQFLKELKEARTLQETHSTLPISPIAGVLEQGQLDFINEMLSEKKP